MESPLLSMPGAVPATGVDAGVAAHYGDPFAEQRALTRGTGFVDRSHRGVVRITGADRLSWLHSLTTQALEKLAPGTVTQALVLSPQGHVQHHLALTDDGEAVWAHVEPGMAASLLAFLDSMKFMLRVEPADVTGEFAVLTLSGSHPAGGPLADVAAALPGTSGTDVVIRRERLPDAAAALAASGFTPAGMEAHEALRIAAHQPRFGLDTDHRTIPHEVGWIETAVHLDKGCYRGQETVARVHNLGHPPRRMVMLDLDGSEDRLPAHGDEIIADGAVAGFVGSASRHYEQGPIGLGLLKRNTPTTAALRAGGVPAGQEVIVAPDAGANVRVTLGRPRGGLAPR